MSRAEVWLFHVANALVLATGAALTWILLWWEPDAYAFGGHPWQPFWQHGHVLAAPTLAFALGIVWTRHILPKIHAGGRRRRSSGYALLLSAMPMAASGYLLQIAVDPLAREFWSWAHIGSSALWAIGTALHFRLRPLARRSD